MRNRSRMRRRMSKGARVVRKFNRRIRSKRRFSVSHRGGFRL